MALAKGHRANFNTMLEAANNGDLALVECQDKTTGKTVVVICMMNREENGDVSMAPVAKMFDGNPYDELNPPDPNGGFKS